MAKAKYKITWNESILPSIVLFCLSEFPGKFAAVLQPLAQAVEPKCASIPHTTFLFPKVPIKI